MTEGADRRGRDGEAGNSVGEGTAGRAWVTLEGSWFITVA